MNQLGIWWRPASKQKEVALEIQLGKCCSCPSIDSSGIELKKRDLHKTLFWKNPRPWGLSWGSKQMGLFVSLGGGHAAKRQLSRPALPLWAGSPTCYEAGVIREMNSTRGIFIGWTHRVSWRPAEIQYRVVAADRHGARLGGGGCWRMGGGKAGQSQRRQNLAWETSVSLWCPWKMNSGDCWLNVWARAGCRGRMRGSGGAGAVGAALTGTKSTCVHRHCVPSPQGKGVTQRYLFRSFTCFSLLLCIVNREHRSTSDFPLPSPPGTASTGPARLFQRNLLSDHDRVPPTPLMQSETCCWRGYLGNKHLQGATAVAWAALLMLCLGLQHSRVSHYPSGCTETWY